ncbi:MAG: YgaP family membrane protein [Lutibacter sp.]
MKKNMGSADKLIRVLIAVVIAVLYYLGKIEGTLAIVLMAFAIIFLLTSLVSFCPLYTIFGIKTNKKETE